MKRAMKQGLLLVLIAVAVGGFVGIQQASYIEGRKEKISLVNISLAAQIEEKINREIYITKILEILIRANENDPFSAFNHTASELLRISPERSAIQLYSDSQPDMLPLEGGGRSDLFAMPDRQTAAVQPRNVSQRIIVGVIERRRNGSHLVSYNPVYDNRGDFWGFSVVSVNIADVFRRTNAFRNVTRDNYCTISVREEIGPRAVFSNIEGVVDWDPVKTEIRLADGTVWVMALAPKEGWLSLEQRGLNAVGAVLAIAALYWLFSNIGRIKRQLVLNERMATLDPLTNTLNKRAFEQKLDQLDQGIEPYGIIFLDLDYFKEINDQYGHDAGDRVLVETVRRMKLTMRDVDKVYRVGGDEFVIFVAGGLSEEVYGIVRDRLKNHIEQDPIQVGAQFINVRISMGYASRPTDSDIAGEVLKAADQRMYQDKQENHRQCQNAG